MGYQLEGDWRVWNARLVADVQTLTQRRRDGMPAPLIAANTLKAMGHVAAIQDYVDLMGRSAIHDWL